MASWFSLPPAHHPSVSSGWNSAPYSLGDYTLPKRLIADSTLDNGLRYEAYHGMEKAEESIHFFICTSPCPQKFFQSYPRISEGCGRLVLLRHTQEDFLSKAKYARVFKGTSVMFCCLLPRRTKLYNKLNLWGCKLACSYTYIQKYTYIWISDSAGSEHWTDSGPQSPWLSLQSLERISTSLQSLVEMLGELYFFWQCFSLLKGQARVLCPCLS